MNVIGIDAGGTLTKIVYEEKGRRHFKTFYSDDHIEIQKCLKFLAPNHFLYLTGGKAENWRKSFPRAHIVDEFQAVYKGTEMLLKKERQELKQYILINIGTGTSFFRVDEKGCERLLGSGLGGGTILGLGSILTGLSDYFNLVSLSTKGKREKVDLLVGDIYEKGDSPIPDHLTASNFGKGTMSLEKADLMRALTNMIAETIILLASHAAKQYQMNTFVFVGSALEANTAFKEDLTQFQDMLSYTAVFPDMGSYAGSLGAYQIGMEGQDSQNRQ
ncbi:type II pantothenate kinase [Rossellomorea aquimaris]|uniref:type II pantothenate kinase n=1 Tax=Rossellomorea TaxID=2837508 RepID=UPI001CD749F0|nr:type II pantothenate kinase [Rossellomorea aquimaris]MCA1059001.1 type II pantothenate kinase [Rossellomorea aquimaris]